MTNEDVKQEIENINDMINKLYFKIELEADFNKSFKLCIQQYLFDAKNKLTSEIMNNYIDNL